MTETKQTVTIKFGATVPIMEYGNFSAEIIWQGEANQVEAEDILNTLRHQVAAQVLHVANHQIERGVERGKFAQVNDVDKWLMTESKPYYWLRTVAPELAIPAFDRLMKGKPNTASAKRGSAEDQTCALCGHVLNGQGDCTNKECPDSIYFEPASKPLPPPIPLDAVNAQLESLMQGKLPAAPAPLPPATPKGNSRLAQNKTNRIPTKPGKVNKGKTTHAN